MSHWPIDHGL